MGSSSSSRAPAASCSNAKKQQGECAGGRKANDDVICGTSAGTDNNHDTLEVMMGFVVLSENESDSSSDEVSDCPSDEVSDSSSDEVSDSSSEVSDGTTDGVDVFEDEEERAFILAEAAALKKAAVDYAHPEMKVKTSDPFLYGRNYFNRLSVCEDAHEDIEQKAQVLADVRALKAAAVDYAHPEVEVKMSDPSVYGRNYFNRVSAPEVEDEDIEERAKILAEAVALKKAAVDYAHPEIKVRTSDPSSYGRNYFSRFSALEVAHEDIEQKAQVLADVRALKTAAVDYAHPEVGVVASDPSVYGRNYFNRVSAPEVEDEDIEERAKILAEAVALKKAAVDYAHPEIKVRTSDPSSYGRNYFSRFSALEVAHEDIEQKAQVLADVRALKAAAVDYAHPEVGVVASDPSVYGRNYYNRYSTDHPAVSTVSTMQYPDTRKERAMSNVSETFEFDDDIFNHMREEFRGMENFDVKKVDRRKSEEIQPEDEGRLSRSPSSVMLFGLADEAAY